MGIYFGTDGIRGVVNDELTYDLAYRCGNALGSTKDKSNILIGCDTRLSSSYLINAFSGGVMSAGSNIVDVGVCTTPGIAYLTKTLGFDYGVVISASHNESKYNGIKIFTKDGVKLGDDRENHLERKFVHQVNVTNDKIGTFTQNFKLIKKYVEHLILSCNHRLDDMKIVIDTSNGASYKIAPYAFKKLGAKVIKINCSPNGKNINHNCGSLHPEMLSKTVKLHKADIGFAFDGDADRIIACDENGEIVDGDKIVYILALYLKKNNMLNKNIVVGTRHTNMGIEKALLKNNITLERTDIGDKYVIAKIDEKKLSLGGEKSGHIIIRDYTTTGDGILTAVKLAEIIKTAKTKASTLSRVKLYPQCNRDVIVSDKIKIINSENLKKEIDSQQNMLGHDARIMVRISGTEPKIRIMVECKNFKFANESALALEKTIKQIDMGI